MPPFQPDSELKAYEGSKKVEAATRKFQWTPVAVPKVGPVVPPCFQNKIQEIIQVSLPKMISLVGKGTQSERKILREVLGSARFEQKLRRLKRKRQLRDRDNLQPQNVRTTLY